jgi:uncharacterized protein YraI
MYLSHDSRVALVQSLSTSRVMRLCAGLALLLSMVAVSFGVPDDTGAVALGRGNYAFGATMFGTAEGDGLVGDTTSSGYRMRPYDRVVALPACTQSSCPWLDADADKNGENGSQTMCAESDGLCWVQIISDVTGECAVAPVRDLGPLFARDNWWGLQRERTYPLKRGLTAAEVTAAGGDVGYGPGMSDVGHDIAEDYNYAAAIDLGPGTWMDLGLDPDRGFSTVQVKLLWQAGVHHLDACGGDYGNAQTIDQVNLRQGPGTGYEILASLPAARRLSITGSMQNGFYLVDTDGMRGWVSRDYVRPDGGSVGQKVGIATDWVNVRWGPGFDYGVATTMPEGATALVTGGRVNGFFPVVFNGIEAWVSASYLDVGVTRSLSRSVGIVTDSVNLRTGPGFDRAILTQIPTGMPVYLTGGPRNGFRPVSYGSEHGWIHVDYLTIADRPETKRVTEDLRLRDFPDTDGEVILVMPAGATVTVTGTAQNGFLPVTYRGSSGWAHSSYLR